MESFERNGVWWLPEAPTVQAAGILKWDLASGATLHIVGQLRSFSAMFEGSNGNAPIVYGLMSNGLVTLQDCIFTAASLGTESYETYSVGIIYVGMHGGEGDLKFERLDVRFAHLEKWLRVSGVHEGFSLTDSGKRRGEITFENLDILESEINDIHVRIRTYANLSGNVIRSLEEEAVIELEQSEALDIDDWHRQFIAPMQNFLSFALDASSYPIEVRAYSNTLHDRNDPRDLVQLFYRANRTAGLAIDEESISPLFTYKLLKDDTGKYLEAWFDRYKILRETFGLYSAAVITPPQFINLQVLLLAQALETYHRHVYADRYLAIEEYNEKVLPYLVAQLEGIPKLSLDKEERKTFLAHLASSFTFGYEYSLRKRIVHIVNKVLVGNKEIVKKVVGDTKKFAEVTADTRNYYTHFVKGEKSRAVTEPQQLLELSKRLKLLMQLCLLVELKVPPEDIELVVRSNDEFQRWMKMPTKLF